MPPTLLSCDSWDSGASTLEQPNAQGSQPSEERPPMRMEQEEWVRAYRQVMGTQRTNTFQKLHSRNVKFGSDCTGGDAAFVAAKIWCADCSCTCSNEMASEAPLPESNAPMLFMLLNHAPKVMFVDMLARGHSGYCILADRLVAVPRDLDIYSAGTMCTDFSNYNTMNPKECLGLFSLFCVVHACTFAS
jgi:hypothetical protein